jgi:hypothetical protein
MMEKDPLDTVCTPGTIQTEIENRPAIAHEQASHSMASRIIVITRGGLLVAVSIS